MPDINPFEETMRAERAGMNIPQRTTRQTQGPAGMGFAPPSSTEYGEGPIRAGQGVGTGFGGGRIGYYEDPTGPTRPPGQPMYGRHMGYGGMDSGIFGGQRASGANDMVNAMLGGMNTSRLQREDELAGIAPSDWRRMWKLQQMGIDPGPHIEQTYWGGPWGGPQWPPKPGDPWPPTGGPPWGPFGPVAERSSDFKSDWKGQQRLMDAIKIKNPGIGEDELMILFQQAMDQATS